MVEENIEPSVNAVSPSAKQDVGELEGLALVGLNVGSVVGLLVGSVVGSVVGLLDGRALVGLLVMLFFDLG